jgi:hypothetical protein
LPSNNPYLSVVVTTRNDDHGGDPLKRLQAFVNTFDAQWRRAGLDAEVIVVEWNPPDDRPRLAGLLRRPADCCFTLRFVEVPPELHNRLQHADVLPLFQMIGKNVGIRRARGLFVLSTNIDIIFSNELVEFLATGLKPGVLFRVDRHDIQPDYPVDAPLADQMAYCRLHQLRVHTRWGSYPVDNEGRLIAVADDIVDGRSIRLGRGWHVKEGNVQSGAYRWASQCVELFTDASAAGLSGSTVLEVDIESSPFDRHSWVNVAAVENGTVLAHTRVAGFRRLSIPLDSGNEHHVELRMRSEEISSIQSLPPFERRSALHYRVLGVRLRCDEGTGVRMFDLPADRWTNANENADVHAEPTAEGLSVETDRRKWSYAVRYGPLVAAKAGEIRFNLVCSVIEGSLTIGVLSGDAARWLPAAQFVNRHEQPGTQEFDLYVQLDRGERCWIVVSNDHPAGEGVSRFIVRELKSSADPATMLGSAPGVGPILGRAWWRKRAAGAADRAAAVLASMIGRRLLHRVVRATPAFQAVEQTLHDRERELRELTSVAYLRGFNTFLHQKRPSNLHQNACGDFQLMAREHWLALRGYSEFAMYSMNIDGLFASIACGAGITEEVLEMPACIYHLEHEKGSGWTPEGEALLRQRIAASGITWLENENVHILGTYMEWLRHPMIFNGPDWGFGDVTLAESSFAAVANEAQA